jgi:hypothetical protein
LVSPFLPRFGGVFSSVPTGGQQINTLSGRGDSWIISGYHAVAAIIS